MNISHLSDNPLVQEVYRKLVSVYLQNFFKITFSSIDDSLKKRIKNDLSREISNISMRSTLGTSMQALALHSEFNANSELFVEYASVTNCL